MQVRFSFILLALAVSGCAHEAPTLVGKWSGTYQCDFPEWSSVKAPAKPSPVQYEFRADGTCLRSERGPGGAMRVDTMTYEARSGTMIWEGGDEASEEIEVVSDDGFVLVYDNGHGGVCRTTLMRSEP